MRILLLMRGAPGCGKSTFIKENGLEQFALSADNIRLMCQSAQLTPDGKLAISQENDKVVWETLFNILAIRMEKGEFTVIDATNSKTSEMKRYKDMCDTYRYRIYCIDFTDLPIKECKQRNIMRTELKQVPEEVIDKMYARFKTQQIPSGIKMIKYDKNFDLNSILVKKFDFNHFENLHVIGDIHGCYTALQEYLKDGIKENDGYVFLGDYIDRGIENAQVIKFLISIKDRKNVLLLEGNHERWLWIFANDGYAHSKEFEFVTKLQLEKGIQDGLFTKADIRQLYRKFGQCAYFDYGDKTYFISHGGISFIPYNPAFISSHQLIHGVGRYPDYITVAETWNKHYSNKYKQFYIRQDNKALNLIQIMGHRNTGDSPIQINETVYNLEGKVEFGGCLRCIDITPDKIIPIETKNTVFKMPDEIQEQEKTITNNSLADTILALRRNKYINEKKFGDISSFNFSKNAFYDKIWNDQIITARGLYIDTKNIKVQARGYAKFFNINEMSNTKLDMLQHRFVFPVMAYVKENGFLGLLSYNKEKDDFLFATKSVIESDYCNYFKELFELATTDETRQKILDYLKSNDVTFVFEVCDQKHDPHIIKYDYSKVVLLDVIENNIEFQKYEYSKLQEIGQQFGLTIKQKGCILNTWSEFYNWYNKVMQEDYKYNGKIIEGFVIEDSNGLMVKAKLAYYGFWKFMRMVAQSTIRYGHFRETSRLYNDLSNYFYGWIKNLRKEAFEQGKLKDIPQDAITLREMFFADNPQLHDFGEEKQC